MAKSEIESHTIRVARRLEILNSNARKHLVEFKSYGQYVDGGLQHPKDTRLHLGLLPQPWFGNVEKATAFILLLNPGLNPGDYFGEYEVPAYKRALEGSLRSTYSEFPFFFFDPLFSWHPGASYFRDRLHWLVLALKDQKGMAYHEALKHVATRVCCIQLVPYHSATFNLWAILAKLPSAKRAKAFVKDYLLERPDFKNVLIIAARQAGQWDLPSKKNIIQYTGSETRAAHLSAKSRGGQALAKHFELHL